MKKGLSNLGETTSFHINTYTIQYNTLLTTPHGGFSVTMQLREVTISKKD